MSSELTIKKLGEMSPNERFATGTGTYPEVHEKEIRWVAVRGEGMPDWCIYYHLSKMTVEYIAKFGDKCFTESVIKRLVPCDEDSFKRYRL